MGLTPEEMGMKPESTVEPKVDFDRASRDEQGVFEKFNGRAKDMAKVMLVLTAFAFGLGGTEEASAKKHPEKKPSVEDTEKKLAAKERSVAFLERLTRAGAPDYVTDKWERADKSKAAARVMVYSFAAREKVLATDISEEDASRGVNVDPSEIKAAIQKLNEATEEYADRYLGNKDGIVDPEEKDALEKLSAENPGFTTLREMTERFK